MKKFIITVGTTIILTALIILSIFELKAQREQLQADHVETIDSKVLSEKRKLLVHLPKDYSLNAQKRYPVIYALDATSHDRDILTASTILSLADQLPETIIVGLVNKDRNQDLTPDYIAKDQDPSDLGNGHKFLEFIEKEAIPLIENNYRTSDYKMISGNSRAGLFTFFCMIENPSLFDAYFCYSPAFWRSENVIANELKKSLDKKEFSNFLYLSLGDKENEKMKNGFNEVINILRQSDSTGLNITYEYTENANHGTNAYLSIPKALRIWNEKAFANRIDGSTIN